MYIFIWDREKGGLRETKGEESVPPQSNQYLQSTKSNSSFISEAASPFPSVAISFFSLKMKILEQ